MVESWRPSKMRGYEKAALLGFGSGVAGNALDEV